MLRIVGLFFYIVSQLVGSTLALAYLRAEFVLDPSLDDDLMRRRYVAPLGSSSLIFNFVFAWRACLESGDEIA
jgi:hypothetical protein